MSRQVTFTPQRATDNDATGAPQPAATVDFYYTGTTTRPTTGELQDVDGNNLANPLTAGGDGTFEQVVYTGTTELKAVIKDSAGGTLYTLDPCPVSSSTGSGASDISYSPTALIPETNVQTALDEVSAILSGTSSEIGIPDGTVTAPGLYFGSDVNNGLYRIGTDNWGISAGGVLAQSYGTLGVSIGVNGTAADPGLQFRSGASAAGFFSPAVGTLGFAVADTEAGRITAAAGLLWGQSTETTPGDATTTTGFALLGNGRMSV